MREKNNPDKSAPDTEQPRDKPDLSLSISGAPAPIDIVAFGKRLGEIITKAVRASRTRSEAPKVSAPAPRSIYFANPAA